MKTAELVFDEYPDKVFVIRLSPVSIAALLDVQDRLSRWTEDLVGLTDRFAEVALVDGSGETLRDEDINLVLALIRQWIRRVAEAPLPLPLTSGAGGPSQARRASKSRRS